MLQDHDLGRVGLLVFQLSDLVGDLLLPIAGWLDGGLDVADGLDGHAILIVAVDELVLKLADFVDQDAELVGYVGNIVVASFTPQGELLLWITQLACDDVDGETLREAYSNFHALTANQFHAAHDVLLHLDELGELLCEIWAEGAGGSLAESMTCD